MDLPDDTNFTIEDFRKERQSLVKASNLQLEELKQSNYSLKRTIERQNMVIQDLRVESESLNELESQQKQTVAENRVLKAKCSSLQETVADLSAAISSIESADVATVSTKPTEIHSVLEAGIDPYFLKMENEIESLKGTVHSLTDSLRGSSLQKTFLNTECAKLKADNQELKTELDELREALKTCRANAAQLSECFEESREQVALMKADIDRMTSDQETPMATKGNSLFSEVEVSRQKLLKRYNDLRNIYQNLQVAHVRKCSDFSKLNAEKAAMCHQWASIMTELHHQDTDMVTSLELRIRQLEEANGRLTEQVNKPVQIMAELSANELKFITDLVTNTRNEVGALADELERRSIAHLACAAQLSATRQELSMAKADLMRTSAQLTLARQAAAEKSEEVYVSDPLAVLDAASDVVEVTANGNGLQAMDCANGNGCANEPATQAGDPSVDETGGSEKTAERATKVRFDSTASGPDVMKWSDKYENTPLAKLNRRAPPSKPSYCKVTIPSVAPAVLCPPEDSEKD